MVNKWLIVSLVAMFMAGISGQALAAEPEARENEQLQQEQRDEHNQKQAHGWLDHKQNKSEHIQLMMKVMEQKEVLFERTLIAAEKGNVKGLQVVKGYHAELKKLHAANKELRQKLMAERKALCSATKKDEKKAMHAHKKEMKRLAGEMHRNMKATSELLDKAIAALQ